MASKACNGRKLEGEQITQSEVIRKHWICIVINMSKKDDHIK